MVLVLPGPSEGGGGSVGFDSFRRLELAAVLLGEQTSRGGSVGGVAIPREGPSVGVSGPGRRGWHWSKLTELVSYLVDTVGVADCWDGFGFRVVGRAGSG